MRNMTLLFMVLAHSATLLSAQVLRISHPLAYLNNNIRAIGQNLILPTVEPQAYNGVGLVDVYTPENFDIKRLAGLNSIQPFDPAEPAPTIPSADSREISQENPSEQFRPTDPRNLDYYALLGRIKPLVLGDAVGTPMSSVFGDAIGRPTPISSDPIEEIPFHNKAEDSASKPTRFYPLQQNNFSPLNDFGLVSFDENRIHKNTEDFDNVPIKKLSRKTRKKYMKSTGPKYPKKYYGSMLKRMNEKPKFRVANEVEEYSPNRNKNKRRIPFGANSELNTNRRPFNAEINSLDSYRGNSHADFSFPENSGDGDRMQFQMYGMDGPHSYKFGYDTGKGHNRHFRFEERDNNGRIKGHYGFYDQEGKMSMMHYEADPHTGYHAGPYRHPENGLDDS